MGLTETELLSALQDEVRRIMRGLPNLFPVKGR